MTGTSNIEEFNREVQAWAETMPANVVVTAQKKLAFDAFAGIDDKMPVDTGHARFNTQVSVNDYARGEIPGVDPTGSVARGRAEAALADIPPFALVVIHNSVPYIERLEGGSSTQAPSPGGIFDLTAHELLATFDVEGLPP
jgi:hypothetical protein